MAPRFCTESRRLAIAFFLDRTCAPRARLAFTMAGSISGTSPTATLMLKRAAFFQFPVVLALMHSTYNALEQDKFPDCEGHMCILTIGTMTNMNPINIQLTLRIPRWKELVSRRFVSSFAMTAMRTSMKYLALTFVYVICLSKLTTTSAKDKCQTVSRYDTRSHKGDIGQIEQ